MISNSSNKTETGKDSVYNDLNTYTNIRYGVVKALESDAGPINNKGLGRIKVYIKGPPSQGGDGNKDDTTLTESDINALPWCFPLLPKHIQVTPKIGEVVLIFLFGKNQQHVDRLYIGPIISQLPLLEKDPYLFSALAGFSFGPQAPNINPEQIAEINGVYSNSEDVTIQGRYNTDIIQKRNEIVIRAGKFVSTPITNNNPYPFKYNTTTPAYIQIKNDSIIKQKTDQQEALRGTITNIIANKINLITHEDGSPRYNVTTPDSLITDEELQNILTTAHQVPFGDILLEYLRLMKDALLNHVHNGSGNPATDLTTHGNKQTIALFKAKADDLEKSMLSQNIRIN